MASSSKTHPQLVVDGKNGCSFSIGLFCAHSPFHRVLCPAVYWSQFVLIHKHQLHTSIPHFSSVTSCWCLQIGHSVRIYTIEISKLNQSLYLLSPLSLFLTTKQHTTASAYGNSLNRLPSRVLGDRTFCYVSHVRVYPPCFVILFSTFDFQFP